MISESFQFHMQHSSCVGLMILYFWVQDFNAKSVKSVLVQQLQYQTLKSPKTTREVSQE